MEPRTTNHIMADLLANVIDGEWSGQTNVGCYSDPKYVKCCPNCGALEWVNHVRVAEHKSDCGRMALINEVRAYLRIENDLAESRGQDDFCVYIP